MHQILTWLVFYYLYGTTTTIPFYDDSRLTLESVVESSGNFTKWDTYHLLNDILIIAVFHLVLQIVNTKKENGGHYAHFFFNNTYTRHLSLL